jgi:hypothetical protein
LPKRTAFGVHVCLLALAALSFAGCGSPRESAFDLRAPRTLHLLTYDGSGQLVHPDVVRWPRSGGDLWMAVTPYPYAREKWENPSIYRSRDGLTWREPAERVNPIVSRPRFDHNCDPDPVVCGDSLRVFYLMTQRAKFRPDGANFQELRVCETADGKKWSEPRTVLRWELDSDPFYLSPCVVPVSDGWRLFLVWPKGRIIRRLSSPDLRSFGEPDGVLETGLVGVRPWHLDIFPVEGGYVALLCARGPDARDNLDVDVWIGASPDLDRWSFLPEPFSRAAIHAGGRIAYSSTGLLEGNRLAIWYSGRAPDGKWLVGATSCDASVVRDLLAAAAAAPPPSGATSAPPLPPEPSPSGEDPAASSP